MPRVSVIVPMFNGIAFLPAFFDSLAHALDEDSQVVLVDDGSTQPVWETVPDLPVAAPVVRLRNERNLGYSVAVNRGFAAASGDIVVQLNTDLVLEPNCITAMIELIEREERVGIVGSKLIFPTNGLVDHIAMAFGNHTKPKVFSDLPAEHDLCRRTREVQIMTGATVAMTRRVLDRLGPLDERYFNHNEDIDHCLVALRNGLRNFVCADSVAYHWKSLSGPARFAQRATSEAILWSRWAEAYEVDLPRFVDEALDHLLEESPGFADTPFEVIDLSRGADQPIVLDRIGARWPGVRGHVRHFRQLNNPETQLWLPLLLPHWVVTEPRPFIYVVDRYRELEANALWFERRRRVVDDELIVDLRAAALRSSDLAAR